MDDRRDDRGTARKSVESRVARTTERPPASSSELTHPRFSRVHFVSGRVLQSEGVAILHETTMISTRPHIHTFQSSRERSVPRCRLLLRQSRHLERPSRAWSETRTPGGAHRAPVRQSLGPLISRLASNRRAPPPPPSPRRLRARRTSDVRVGQPGDVLRGISSAGTVCRSPCAGCSPVFFETATASRAERSFGTRFAGRAIQRVVLAVHVDGDASGGGRRGGGREVGASHATTSRLVVRRSSRHDLPAVELVLLVADVRPVAVRLRAQARRPPSARSPPGCGARLDELGRRPSRDLRREPEQERVDRSPPRTTGEWNADSTVTRNPPTSYSVSRLPLATYPGCSFVRSWSNSFSPISWCTSRLIARISCVATPCW